jgi:hypothetical protein
MKKFFLKKNKKESSVRGSLGPRSIENMEGYLWKKSPSLGKEFQKRWFSLSGTQLYYLESMNSSAAKGHIDLNHALKIEALPEKKSKYFLFEIHTTSRVYTLGAETKAECDLWLQALTEVKKANSGRVWKKKKKN